MLPSSLAEIARNKKLEKIMMQSIKLKKVGSFCGFLWIKKLIKGTDRRRRKERGKVIFWIKWIIAT